MDGVVGISLLIAALVGIMIYVFYAAEKQYRVYEQDPKRIEELRQQAEREKLRRKAEQEELRKQAEREQRRKRFQLEAEYTATIRRLELEVEERARRLSKLHGDPPKKVLIAELELAEKEAELAYAETSGSMTDEQREAFWDRLTALREQLQREKGMK